MWTPVHPAQLARLSAGDLATVAAPERWHGPLRALGTHCRDGSWVVSGPREVAAALACPELSVAPAGGLAGPAGLAADLLLKMARFSDGADHRRRRDLLNRLMPAVAQVARIAGARANDFLSRRTASFDIMPMARQLPAEVLARALGFAPDEAARAAVLTGVLCDAFAPALQPRPATAMTANQAATELDALARRLDVTTDDETAAAVSILFQARDATAALIGTSVLAAADDTLRSRAPGQRVEHVLRRDAPVQCTRRTALTDMPIGDAMVPAGASVWIFMAAAERGDGLPATFGSGPHGCPGAAQAAAIARQVVTVLEADGWQPVHGQRVDFEPRPSIRMPVRVQVSRQ